MRTSNSTARAAATVVLLIALMPAPSPASAVFSHGEMTIDGWFKAKSFEVTVEAVHSQDGPDPVGAPPVNDEMDEVRGGAEVCIVADSFVTKGRVRKAIREQACPSRSNAFRFDMETFEAVVDGKVKTARWFRKWEVKGGRWVLVRDKTTTERATVRVRWRWSERPQPAFAECGSGSFDQATGLAGTATATGTIVFHGSKLTARIPAGTTGYMFMGACAAPL